MEGMGKLGGDNEGVHGMEYGFGRFEMRRF